MADKVVIKGLAHLDGEYEFDIVKMVLSPGDPEFMTYREWHVLKVMSGVRSGEVLEALDAGDTSVNLALISIILRRSNKVFDDDMLWDAPGTTEIRIRIESRQPEAGDAEIPPVSEPPDSELSGKPTTSIGSPSRPTLVSPENDQSRTGDPGVVPSVPVTSVISQ